MAIIYWIVRHLTGWCSSDPFSLIYTDLPGLQLAIEAQDGIGRLASFEGCIAVEWAGVQEAQFILLGRHNTGKRWATSLVVKLLQVAWDLWDHRNQVKHNLETAQDLARHDSILLAIRSVYTFGRAGLPRRDWHLFQRPLLSLLDSSLHYLDAWLHRVKIARSRHGRRIADIHNQSTSTAKEHLPNLAGPRRIMQQFLKSVSPP
jgi:hypothetical protein